MRAFLPGSSLCGFPPFYHESTAALYKQIKKV